MLLAAQDRGWSLSYMSKPAYTLMTESQWLNAAHSELPMICKTGFP